MTPPLDLSVELLGHTGAVRCCVFLQNNPNGYFAASGGQDNNVILWKYDDLDCRETSFTTIHHSCWIISLLALPNGRLLSGGYDGIIRLYSEDGNVLAEMPGHSNGVVSLAHGPKGTVISGSWDGSAKIWNLDFLTCENTLGGMENAVSAAALGEDTVVTTSTGIKSENDSISGFCVRLWRQNQVVATITEHRSSIRCVATWYASSAKCETRGRFAGNADGFLTGGNDGQVVVYDARGAVLERLQCPPNAEGKDPFLMKVREIAYEETTQKRTIAAVSEDCTLRLWSGEGEKVIRHPNSVWDLDSRGYQKGRERVMEVLTACSDGVVRLFSSEEERFASMELRTAYAQLCEANANQLQSKLGVDVSALPDYADRHSYAGRKEGEIRMFRKGTQGFCFKWSMESATWIEIGEVVGSSNDKQVLPVEVETAEGVRTLQLEFRGDDNPYEVAQAFIDTHSLSQDNLEEIAAYILKNRAPGRVQLEAQIERPFDLEFHSDVLPETCVIKHAKLATAGILRKLGEFNNVMRERQLCGEDVYVMDEQAILTLSAFLQAITDKTAEWTPAIEEVLRCLLQWPLAYQFPVLDILKAYCLLPGSESPLQRLLPLPPYLERLSATSPSSLFLVLFRFLCNLSACNSPSIPPAAPSIFRLSKALSLGGDPPFLQAQASFLLNFTILASRLPLNEATRNALDSVVAISCDILRRTDDPVAWSRSIAALANSIILSPRSYRVIDSGANERIRTFQSANDELQRKVEETRRLSRILDASYSCLLQCKVPSFTARRDHH